MVTEQNKQVAGCGCFKMNFFGIININKPKGFTSHDVVAKLRKILNIKQIGHTGTLDPMATGVLPVCIGKATKVIQYLESQKAYRAFIQLGIKTDTYDVEGELLEKKTVKIDLEEIKKHLESFKGEITQTPPIYSAVHYKGKRLYEYARKNIEIKDIPTRQVTIKTIELIDIQDKDLENPILIIDIDCSEGTYIRSIAHNLGEKLGYGACLKDLIRTKAGRFYLEKSFSIKEIEEHVKSGTHDKFLVNPTEVLPLEILEIEEDLLIKIKNGQYFQNKHPIQSSIIQLVNNNKLIAIAKAEENTIKPTNVFI